MVDLKDSKFTQEQKVRVYDFIEEHCNTFNLCDKLRTCPQVEVHPKLCDEVPFFVFLYVIREEQNLLMENTESPWEIWGY